MRFGLPSTSRGCDLPDGLVDGPAFVARKRQEGAVARDRDVVLAAKGKERGQVCRQGVCAEFNLIDRRDDLDISSGRRSRPRGHCADLAMGEDGLERSSCAVGDADGSRFALLLGSLQLPPRRNDIFLNALVAVELP